MSQISAMSSTILLALSVTLTACGGGGSAPATTPGIKPGTGTDVVISKTKVGGKVIDGYVSGANVWLDINGNQQKDADEPSVISQKAGDYVLELTKEQLACAAYSTLYVDVPVGAIDEDTGPVTAAYQMSRPPQFKALTQDDVLHISPLTTVLSEQIRQKLAIDTTGMSSCATLQANEAQRQKIKYELEDVIRSMVQKHNIAAEKIFADFIQNSDKSSYDLAQNIVKALKASYAYRDVLKAKYPAATYIRTLFYQGSELDPGHAQNWYRDSNIWFANGFKSELMHVNADLNTVNKLIFLREKKQNSWKNGTYSFVNTALAVPAYQNRPAGYACSSLESVETTTGGISYKLSNSADTPDAKEPTECQAADFQTMDWRTYSISYSQNGINYITTYHMNFANAEFSYLKDWFNLANKADALDLNKLTERLAATGYKFEEASLVDVYSWDKRSTDDRTKNRIQIDRQSNGLWTRQTTRDDQTIVKECSNDGITWGKCAEAAALSMWQRQFLLLTGPRGLESAM